MAQDFTGNDYLSGQPYGLCDRCGEKHRLKSLRKEWTNLKVCGPCFDPRPAQLDPPQIDPNEGKPLPDSRPQVLMEATDEQADWDPASGRS